MKAFIYIVALSFWAMSGIAQEEKIKLIEGNKSFEDGDFAGAAERYQGSYDEELQNIATYNLGDALYRQGKFDEAAEEFGKVAQSSENEDLKSRALHNLGNSYLSKQEFAKAMNAYKNALRVNPNDADSRYNLAYSRKMLAQQEQQEQEQNEDQEKQDDQEQNQEQDQGENNEENQEQGENEQDKEGDQEEQNSEGEGEQDENGEPQDQDGEKQDQQKPGEEGESGQGDEEKEMPLDPNKLSPEQAARLLEALDKAEEDLQGKLRKHKKSGKAKKIEKDW